MKKPKNDAEFCEAICKLEGEIEIIENELQFNRNPFQRKEHQSLLYEKRKQYNKLKEEYSKYISKHSIS